MKRLTLFLVLLPGFAWGQPLPPPRATQAEVNTATDNYKYVTPYTMKNWTGGPTNVALLNANNIFTGSNTFSGPIFANEVEASTFVADAYYGDFANATNLNASNLTSGTVPDARLATSVVLSNSPTIHTPTLWNPTVQGTLTATQFNVGMVTVTNTENAAALNSRNSMMRSLT